MFRKPYRRDSEPAQPLLKGINLARFLCDSCPFYQNTKGRDGKTGIVRACPPPEGLKRDECRAGPICADDSGLPGRL